MEKIQSEISEKRLFTKRGGINMGTSSYPLTFIIRRNELEGRIDVEYYKPEYRKIQEKLRKSPFKLVKLKDIAFIVKKGIFEIPASEYVEDGVPFIRVSNIKDLSISRENLVFITEERHKKEIKTCFESGDIVISKSGTLANVGVIPDEIPFCNISQDVIGVKLKPSVNPLYIAAFLESSLGRKQLLRGTSLQVVPHLTLDHVRNVMIPLPPRSIQDKIANLIKDALTKKKDFESRSRNILRSINDYLLLKLGITLPSISSSTPYIYNINAKFLSRNRWDVEYWKPFYIKLIDEINNGKYKVEKLSNIVKDPITGARPKGGVRNAYGEIFSVGGEHINDDGSILLKNPKFISIDFHKKMRKSWIEPQDILIVKDGATTGKVGFIDVNSEIIRHNINEHIFILRVRDKESHNPFYIFVFLWSILGQLQIRRHISGSTQFGITRKIFTEILIPLPPKSIQNEIAEEVHKKMKMSRDLLNKGAIMLDMAKRKVERIILGEEEI